LGSAHAPRPPLVIVASTAQIQTLECKHLVDAETVVANPVHREVLLSALRAACGQRPSAAAPRPADRAAIGGHILLVEDEPVNAAVAQGYLAEIGCTSVWVGSGAEAIARSASERFDLIMMDLNMPAMDGFATTRLIREREGSAPRVPIIALTAHEGTNYRESCLEAGMDDLMSKPYTLDQCARLLGHWIKREPASIAAAAEIDGATVTGLKSLRSAGQGDLYARLVELFQTTSTQAIVEIAAALGADDFEAARAVCHKLASSAANVGALAFSRHVRQLEQLCEERDRVRAGRLFDAVRTAHPRLIEELTLRKFRESA
jgi:CheY-like chemotaxis protein